jgi:flagellar basal-body rod protein FlgB
VRKWPNIADFCNRNGSGIAIAYLQGLPVFVGPRGELHMKAEFMEDRMLTAMGSYLSRLSRRQQIIASNLANVDTPGYKSKEISFNATMQELMSGQAVPMATTRPEHQGLGNLQFSPMEPEVYEVQGFPVRGDGNNVEMDRELLKLSETSFGYATISQILRGKFRMLFNVINDGRA